MAASVEAGQFAFTTYGYGHCVGMSQNGANYYATYGGYDYQSILFHYFPGTTLVQEGAVQHRSLQTVLPAAMWISFHRSYTTR